jgi:hypothetical protein
MPLIRFENKKKEGVYLLMMSGQVGWFPDDVFGVTEFHLQQIDPVLKEKGIRYRRFTPDELNKRARRSTRKRNSRP